MLNRITELKVVPNKPWESLKEVEILRYANYCRIDTNQRMRGLVERTYRKEHERWVKADAEAQLYAEEEMLADEC